MKNNLNTLENIDFNVEATRTNYTKLADELEKLYQKNPHDSQTARAFGEKLMQLGNIEKAHKVLTPFLEEKKPEGQAIYLAAQIAYLSGDREGAEQLYKQLLSDYSELEAEAETGLEMIYYQTNQYQKAKTLSGKYASYKSDVMNACGTKEPNKVNWNGTEESTVPFVTTDPLPVVEVEVNGQVKRFVIDTGTYETYLNEATAKELGIESVASQKFDLPGGKSEMQFGILDSIKLGSITLESLPVQIDNIDRTSYLYDFPVIGTIGKGVFKQFLTTIDYLDGKLILRSKKAQLPTSAGALEESFIEAGTHFTLCKSKINGKEVRLFVDSGLAADASLLLSSQAIEYVGVTPLEAKNGEDAGSGVGYFTVVTYEFSNVSIVDNMKGISGVFPDSYYFDKSMNTFVEGIVSHNFLKNYRWTIDYHTMTMTFEH